MATKRPSTDSNDVGPVEKRATCPAVFDGVPLLVVHAHRRGEREFMEDEVAVHHRLLEHVPVDGIQRLALYAMYDGHNGGRASEFCAKNMHLHFVRQIQSTFSSADVVNAPDRRIAFEKCIKKMTVDAYKSADEEYLARASREKPSWKDGCTATTALFVNDTIYMANVGDSRAIVCRHKEGGNIALTLTKDHSPSAFDERKRIESSGGVIKEGRILGQLAVSRSIGDGQYKKHGVICTPDLKKCSITDNDRFVLLACDGLWNAFPDGKHVIDFIDEHLPLAIRAIPRVPISTAIPSDPPFVMTSDLWRDRWTWVADKLCEEAVKRATKDNVSVVIIPIGSWFMQV